MSEHGSVTDESSPDGPAGPRRWLAVPEVAERLGVPVREVRSAVTDRRLLGVRPDGSGAVRVPEEFLVGSADGTRWEILPSLRGTLVVLSDAGLSDDEILEWLFRRDDSLGAVPIEALRTGSTHAVRRVAQAL